MRDGDAARILYDDDERKFYEKRLLPFEQAAKQEDPSTWSTHNDARDCSVINCCQAFSTQSPLKVSKSGRFLYLRLSCDAVDTNYKPMRTICS